MSVLIRDVCIGEMCELERLVYERDVCIREICVLEMCLYYEDVCISITVVTTYR